MQGVGGGYGKEEGMILQCGDLIVQNYKYIISIILDFLNDIIKSKKYFF